MDENEISYKLIGAAIEVQNKLGPGLLESVYHRCLEYELKLQGFTVSIEHPVAAAYKGMRFEAAYRMDMLINDKVIVELKAVSEMKSLYMSQLLSYLRLSEKRLGILINFHAVPLRAGIKRIVNNL